MAETNRGILGASELTAGTATAVYTVGSDLDANVNIKVVNKSEESAEVSIALVDGVAANLADEDYIRYECTVEGNSSMSGDDLNNIDLTATESVVVTASHGNVTCVVTGVEQDEASSSDGYPLIRKITSQALAVADFTDNTDTTGYIDVTTQLPAGAVPLGFKAVVTAGFTGDTSATIQVGIAGDLDRFSLNTDQSVFAAASVGSLAATDGADGMNAAQTIRVTVTGASDFSLIQTDDNGAMTVEVYYIATA